MTAEDRLGLIQAKVERAEKHIGDLEVEIRTFFATHPYKVGTKHDSETRQPVHYLVSVSPTPIAVATITGDAIQNLRSALDHLAQALVVVGTGKPGPFYRSEFPICDSAQEYEARKGGKVAGMRKVAKEAIDAIKPYKGGNDTLWRLHKLNLTDKHRFLITVGSQLRSIDFGGFGFRRILEQMDPDNPRREALAELIAASPPHAFFSPVDLFGDWSALKAGDEVFRGIADDEADEDLELRFEVAFGESEITEGEPLLETLHQMAELVGNLVATFRPLLK